MKKNKLLLASAIVISLLIPMSQVKADWHRDNVGWWYSLNNGSYYKNSDAFIDWKLYHFNNSGYMVTGWDYHQFLNNNQKEEGWFYYDPVSGAQQTGWKKIDGKWYYLSHGGAYTGIRTIDGKDYYFDRVNCDMKTGWILEEDSNGNSRWYYYDPESGERLSGWQTIDGKRYYLNASAVHGTVYIDGKVYYFDPVNYDMQTGWVLLKDSNGNPERYYYDPESGERLLGWQEIDGKKYYLTSYGTYRDYIYTIDGKLYYFDPVTRELITGWFELHGNKYYADPNDGGALASNKTLIIDGVSYSFYAGGNLITNQP